MIGDLGDVVERAEGDVAVTQNRRRTDRQIVVRAVAEHRARQPQRSLRGQVRHVARVDDRVGDAEVVGRHPADRGVAQVGHLQGCGTLGEKMHPRVGGVTGQVHQDVDGIGRDAPTQMFVRQAFAFHPVRHLGLQPFGDGVAPAQVVIAGELESAAVMQIEQTAHEVGHRMAHEVARHEADPELLSRRQRLPRWTRTHGPRQCATKLGVGLEDRLGSLVQVVQAQQQHRMKLAAAAGVGQRAPAVVQGLFEPARLHQRAAQFDQHARIGIERGRLLGPMAGRIDLTVARQQAGQHLHHRRVGRVEAQPLLVQIARQPVVTERAQAHAQAQAGFDVRRIEGQRLVEGVGSVTAPPRPHQQHALVAMQHRIERIERHRTGMGLDHAVGGRVVVCFLGRDECAQ